MTQAAKPPEEPIRYHAVVDLPIDKIIPSPDNPRKIKAGDKAITELVESIKATGGVIVPVIVRVHPAKPGMYDLRAGACRLMACTIAGFTTIKAEVMELNDHQAREITTVENLKRKDLTPMEEAQGIKLLLSSAADPGDMEHVAATLGWPIGKVYRRMAITNLTAKWQKALARQGTIEDARGAFGQWGIGHMELIARHDQTTQDQLLKELTDEWVQEWSVDALRKWLGQKFLLITRALWNPKDETLHPKAGACINCPKRSSLTPHLFDDLDAGKTGEGDRCLDPACWNEKMLLFIDRRAVELKADNPKLVFVASENIYGETQKALDKKFPGVRPVWNYECHNVKKADKGAIPAMVVYGDGAGTIRYVKPNREDSGSGRSSKAKGPDGHLTMKAKRERLEGRRAAHAIEALKGRLRKFDPVNSLIDESTLLLVLLAVFGTARQASIRDNAAWKAKDILKGSHLSGTDQEWHAVVKSAWSQLEPIFAQRLNVNDCADAIKAIPEAKEISDLLGINFGELMNQSVEAIPEPKSWAAEKPVAKGKADKKKPGKATKPVKGACRICGCTETTPCIHPKSGDSCAWADKTETICTACKDKAKKKK